MQSVCEHLALSNPFSKTHETYCLLEWEEQGRAGQEILSCLEGIQKKEGIAEVFLGAK